MIRLIVHGAKGRMGTRICVLARDDPRFDVAAEIDLDTPPAGAIECDVVVDFSSPPGVERAARIAVDAGAALLVGTTGLSGQNAEVLDDAARSVPVLVAANTSLGVAVLNHLASEAARVLGADFDIDIIETHHVGKKDAPSGTALRIAGGLRDRAGVEIPPERIHAVRSGDVVGEHLVAFAGPGERLTLTHSATSRDLFVVGALRAAAWLAGKPAGRYTIEQTLGLAGR